jgi:hypothetical protein
MRALALSVALAAGLVAGCSSLLRPAAVPAINPTLSQQNDARGMRFTLDPWPLDRAIVFLCLKQPGNEFSVEDPVPAAAARCTPLDVTSDGERVVAAFSLDAVAPELADDFANSAPPWWLAAAGSRGPTSSTIVTQIVVSPIPSDAGPS